MSEQQYALVHSNEVLAVTPFMAQAPEASDFAAKHPPDSKWLPIVDEDARPFDPEQDYRLKPYFVVADDRVRRVYAVIRQAEHT